MQFATAATNGLEQNKQRDYMKGITSAFEEDLHLDRSRYLSLSDEF